MILFQLLGISLGLILILASPTLGLPYSLAINATNSLSDRLFWLTPPPATWHDQDYAVFIWAEDYFYPRGSLFIKQIMGVPGDKVDMIGSKFYINGKYMGELLPETSGQKPLEAGPTGVIPTNFYFVYAPHPKSLDSRYQAVGWLSKNALIAQAIPVKNLYPWMTGRLSQKHS
ncbi:MAG: S26 family signal peptidase [Gammaproteobacteria bacterium]|nr:S26 family signal peptidase [Gammaproteobacteria bacterium]